MVPEKVLEAFKIKGKPILMTEGQGDNYRCRGFVLKKIDNEIEAEWIAETLSKIKQDDFRVSKYLKSEEDKFVYENWIAYEFLEGVHQDSNYKEIFKVYDRFHQALSDVPCPDFIKNRNNPWSIADRVVWNEQSIEHCQNLRVKLDRLKQHLRPLNLPNQIIHGDFEGNILFHSSLPPAIIDFSPYCRPKEFGKAVIIVDALVWGGADESILNLVENIEKIGQLIIRAEMRRLIEIEECLKHFKKGSLSDIDAHIPTIDLICERFKSGYF